MDFDELKQLILESKSQGELPRKMDNSEMNRNEDSPIGGDSPPFFEMPDEN